MFEVTFTADRFTEESLEDGIAAESGYVDLNWRRDDFLLEGEIKVEEFDTRKEAEQHIMDSIGSVEPSGDSYYAVDSVMTGNGDTWSYAGHITEG